jgi:hypothetical protein
MKAFHIDVWTDQEKPNGKPEKRSYAAMATTQGEGLELARAKLPSTWRIEAPQDEPTYGLAVIKEFGLKPGDVSWIS